MPPRAVCECVGVKNQPRREKTRPSSPFSLFGRLRKSPPCGVCALWAFVCTKVVLLVWRISAPDFREGALPFSRT